MTVDRGMDSTKLKEVGKPAKKPVPTSDEVESTLDNAGGKISGGENDPRGLVNLLEQHGASHRGAKKAVENAIRDGSVSLIDTPNPNGGRPIKTYITRSHRGLL